MAISLLSFEKIFPRFASIAPLKVLTFDHLLCPDIFSYWLRIEGDRSEPKALVFPDYRPSTYITIDYVARSTHTAVP